MGHKPGKYVQMEIRLAARTGSMEPGMTADCVRLTLRSVHGNYRFYDCVTLVLLVFFSFFKLLV